LEDENMESFEHKGLTIKIEQDEYPQNPRKEFDYFGHMICFHRNYDLGDSHDIKSSDFAGWAEIREYLIKNEDATVILPLYLLDHSGLWMRTGTFSDVDSGGWDSGQVGWIYAKRADILKEYSVKKITRKLLSQVESLLESEVKEYTQYLEGDVWHYDIETPEGETLDCCGGFYGFDFAKEQAIEQADWQVKHIEAESAKARQFQALQLAV
jgi:hypothetical protein